MTKTRSKREDPANWSGKNIPRFASLSGKEKMFFAKYLGVMLDAGIPLDKGLQAIHDQSKSSGMHKILHVVLTDIGSGEFLSDSLRKFPRTFDNLFVNMVRVGEESGTLSNSMFRLAEHIEKVRDLQSKVRGATLYPLIVVAGTLGTAAYLVLVLLPQLLPLFTSLGVDLPWSTKVVFAFSTFLIHQWPWIIVGAIAAAAFVALLLKIQKTHYAIDWVLIKTPVLGPLITKIQIAQLASVCGTLLKSGITIIETLKIASDSADNLVYRKFLNEVSASIQEGESFSIYLTKHPALFPGFVTQMIDIGEETGKLDESFLYIATFAEREVDEATKTLTTVLEPLLLLVVGGFVGFIAIAIITPIYSLTTGIHK